MKLSKVWPKTDGAVAVSVLASEIAAKSDEADSDKTGESGTVKRGKSDCELLLPLLPVPS